MSALKAVWTVKVGVLPHQPLDDYSKQWTYTSEDYELDRTCETYEASIFYKLKTEAQEYADRCQHPSSFNWAQLEFTWM